MYCVRCGVKLADTEKICPLCATVVYHPDVKQGEAPLLYPQGKEQPMPSRSLRLPGLMTVIFVLAGIIAALCNQQTSGALTWSGYVLTSLLAVYVWVVLPLWFRKPNPVIFVPCSFAAALGLMLYVCLATGGKWFVSFAFPVTGGVALIVTAMVTLLRYVPRGRLYIWGGGAAALGCFAVLTEFLLNITFAIPRVTYWSLYPLVILVLLGYYLIFLGICRPAREWMARKFFI